MTDNNKAFQDGLNQNTYTGNGSDYEAWQRGNNQNKQFQREREASMQSSALPTVSGLPGYLPAGGGVPVQSTEGGDMSIASGFITAILYPALPVLFICSIVAMPCVAVAALFAAPFMRVVERMLGSKNHLSIIEAYKLMFKSIAAYTGTLIGLGGLFAVLGRYVLPGVLGSFSHVVGALFGSISNPAALGSLSFPQILGTVGVLQLPALASFGLVMRQGYSTLFAEPRALWQGMIAGIATIAASAAGMVVTIGIAHNIF